MPLVSVILPNYNYSQYLEQRIDSILNQTIQDIEVIMLDDCSTDNSLNIMEQYQKQDARIVAVVRNQTNSGSPFQQWSKGIKMAKGKYIWIAEADDYADRSFLETIIEVFSKNKNIVLAKSSSHMVDETGTLLNKDYDHWKSRGLKPDSVCLYDQKQFAKMQYMRNHIYNASCVVFRRDAIKDTFFNDLSYHFSGDWLFWTHIGTEGLTAEVNKRLNYFRFHESSTTHTGAYKAFLEDIEILSIMQKEFGTNFFQNLWRKHKLFRRLKRMGFDAIQIQTIKGKIKENL